MISNMANDEINKYLKAAGFSERETVVLLCLFHLGRATISRVCKESALPRTTAVLTLRTLEQKDAVLRIQVGKHDEWEAQSPESIYRRQKDIAANLKSVLTALKDLGQQAPLPTRPVVSFYHGLAGIKKCYDSLFSLQRGERVLCFEGSRAFQTELDVLPTDYVVDWQRTFRDRGLIGEVAISEDLLEHIHLVSTPLLEASLGHPLIVCVLPREAMDLEADILTFRDTVIIVMPEDRLGIWISERKIAQTFQSLLRLAMVSGRRIDLNAFIRKELETQKT